MPYSPHTVNVFLCANQRDMQAEREYLHLRLFPQLVQWFANEGIAFEVFDMGWRTDEAGAEGFEKLKVALDLVERCRPYFICLMGQRYGKGVETIAPEVMAAYPWLRTVKKGMSRIHLEIMQALLNEPARSDKSFFYVRQPDSLKHAPANVFGAVSPAEEARRTYLLNAIRATGRPVREYCCQWDPSHNTLSGFEELDR